MQDIVMLISKQNIEFSKEYQFNTSIKKKLLKDLLNINKRLYYLDEFCKNINLKSYDKNNATVAIEKFLFSLIHMNINRNVSLHYEDEVKILNEVKYIANFFIHNSEKNIFTNKIYV
ncbi:hypothetical protein [Enterococcus faecalis]|uniref:hypothetical protein n=1 Tax=Enterococcus faecalis TaxID=1351 RepID=UPI00177B6C2D|nr:hypothetical protein [Enterococcus faecalis]MBD9836219.1 hypothetical protein [Enterococcus faecalis]